MSTEPDGESYGGYSVDDEDQLQPGDSLVDRNVDDVLDEGYTAPEKWSPAQGFGSTAEEQEAGESLDQRIAQETPNTAEDEVEHIRDQEDADDRVSRGEEELDASVDEEDPTAAWASDEVGEGRAGRLVAPDEGIAEDVDAQLIADDEGIAGSAASSEEAAVHIVPDEG